MIMTEEPPTERSVMAVIRAARPSFRNANDKVAFAVHATLFASGFVLRATSPAAFSSEDPYPGCWYKEVGIKNWNQLDANYAFVYSNSDVYAHSNNLIDLEKIVVKCLALNGKLHVDALKTGYNLKPDVIARMDIDVEDYVPEHIDGAYYNKYNYGSMFKDFGSLVRYVHNKIVTKLSRPPQPVMPSPSPAHHIYAESFDPLELSPHYCYQPSQFSEFPPGSREGKEVKKIDITEKSVMALIRVARPSFRNDHDKVAFAVHATLMASGFVLRAIGPVAIPHKLNFEEVDIEHWNQHDFHYAFVYSNSDDQMGLHKLRVDCFAVNDTLHIIASTLKHPEVVANMQINIKDYVTEIDGGSINKRNKSNYDSMFKNFGKLVGDVCNKIVEKYVTSPSTGLSSPPPPTPRFPEFGPQSIPEWTASPPPPFPSVKWESSPSGWEYSPAPLDPSRTPG